MLDKQLLDERSAVMVFLLLERLRGPASRWAPWIAALPTSFDVPLCFAEPELAALRGTALAGAAGAMRRTLAEQWSRLEGPLRQLARELGLRAPTMADWQWAHCVFWSRGQSLPVPESGTASEALAGHSSAEGDRSGSARRVRLAVVEALVPGLDFANHRQRPPPQCWWEVVVPERERGTAPSPPSSLPASAPGPTVRLQLHGGVRVAPGEELTISYGDKSNEELLALYGFALKDNAHDHLMLHCPLPPVSEWDDVMHARVELLKAYGLRPQFFLPHPDRVSPPAAAEAQPAKRGKRRAEPVPGPQGDGAGAAGSDSATAGPPPPPLVLPGEVLDTLEVFVLNFQELAARSRLLQAKMEERRAARAAGTPVAAHTQHSPALDLVALRARLPALAPAELRHHLAALGLRMGTLTTLIRLLEIKVTELEGEGGTGPLEADEALLARMEAEEAASSGASSGGASSGASSGGASSPADADAAAAARTSRRLRAAVVYRCGQKRLARAWLVRARGEVAGLLGLLRAMQERLAGLERGAGR